MLLAKNPKHSELLAALEIASGKRSCRPEENCARYAERIRELGLLNLADTLYEKGCATGAWGSCEKYAEIMERLSLHDRQEATYLKRTLVVKKRGAKLQAIYDILQTFHVQPVFNQGRGQCALEVCGERTNVELADYIAHFLDHELERLWLETKRQNQELKGALAKNSFYRGVARGYLAKHKQTHTTLTSNTKEVLLLKQDLALHTERAYPRLSSVSTNSAREHAGSLQHGFERGSKLNIRPGLTGHHKGPVRLLE